jgi:hypothetical protein
MTDVVPESHIDPTPEPSPQAPMVDDHLVGMLVDRARAEGLQLTGEGGLLQQLTPAGHRVRAGRRDDRSPGL